ncbi:MAG: NlpC/P60 family protein [Agathobacter sp.]|nr:NlpC/P60 family protein [Agathobacter sp.]
MVIHTKEKAKIHTHEAKAAKIKGSNIYTVERGLKTAGAKATEADKKKIYRRSTIHQSEVKNKGLSRFKRNIKEANTSIKTKNTNLHIAGRAGALTAGAVTEQVDGGQEVSQAAYLAYEASRPVTGTASKGAELFRKKAAEQAKKRIKKVEAGRKLAKQSAKKAAKDTAKTVAKEIAKTTTKVATKTATKAAATVAGTAVAPGVGTAVGMAAGYAAGVSIEAKDAKATNRSRKIKFFLDKMKAQENQTDSFAKLVKDLVVRKAIMWVKVVAPIIGLVLLLLVLLVAIVAIPVIAVIAILYNSPFALFLPPLESGDTVQTVTSAYVSEFNRDVNTKVNEHAGCDIGELVYVDYEGMEENPSNYYDIMAVYMVKYGVGDTATVMNDKSKGWLQTVVNDMCSYTTSAGTKDVEETDADGNVTTVTKSVLYVNVTLKSYRDMISVYGFDANQVEMLEQIMSDDFMGQLGYAGSGSGGGGGSPGVSSMTEDEINAILSGITDSRQKKVCSYALHRVGFPYSQDMRDSGNYYDCSSLAYYSWKDAGVDISHGGATTAAAEAQGLDEAGKTVSYDEMQPGDLIFYSFTNNGRYKNISHVAVYVGNGKVVEALNESAGVVYRDVASVGKIVVIGRP